MANVLHKIADPVDYRTSVNTPDFPPATWFINPDISAVAAVPQKYWKRPLTDPVTEMTQGEKDAVDAAEATAATQANRDEPVGETTEVSGPGVRVRALIELFNKRDNYLVNRIIQLENTLAAMMDSAGGSANMKTDAIAAAAAPFPQTQSVGAGVHFAATSTRPKSAAVTEYVDDINAGNQDT